MSDAVTTIAPPTAKGTHNGQDYQTIHNVPSTEAQTFHQHTRHVSETRSQINPIFMWNLSDVQVGCDNETAR